MYRKLMWYPWLKYVIRSIKDGTIVYRFPIQSDNGKTLSIVLNGPSVNRTVSYLNPNETDVMMVNDAPLTPLFKELNPKYICFADGLYALRSGKCLHIKEEIRKCNNKITIFFPHYLKKQKVFNERLFDVRYIFSPVGPVQYDIFSYRLLEKNLMTPRLDNVGLICLYVGIQQGYKKIYLYGADEDFMKNLYVDKTNKVMRTAVHYYGDEEVCTNTMIGLDMKGMMHMAYSTFSGFEILQKYAQYEGVSIINMSDTSWLDCFERFNGFE